MEADNDNAVTPLGDLERFRVTQQNVALLLVDFQERLAAAMPEAERIACERNIALLLEMARRQAWPVVVSEQYPKGLGPTVPALASALSAPGLALQRLEKLQFSCTDTHAFRPLVDATKRTHWVVTGMEAHVCVLQTARGLLAWGRHVHVPRDTVISRRADNRRVALRMLGQMGAVVTTTETVIFDALREAGTDDFRALSKLLR
jgi:nicotinamidase-related amidase